MQAGGPPPLNFFSTPILRLVIEVDLVAADAAGVGIRLHEQNTIFWNVVHPGTILIRLRLAFGDVEDNMEGTNVIFRQ